MLTERQKFILKLIVEEHVRTAEPVGSKILSECEELDCSSATIRNEMMVLEEEGLLQKTHTSSGRIPTEKGYKVYVQDIINTDHQLNKFPMIDQFFNGQNFNREQAIKKSMSLVSDLTNYASVALGDTAHISTIKKLQFVSLGNNLGVLLLVTDKGYVESKKIIIPQDVYITDVDKIINVLNEILYDCPIALIDETLKEKFKNEEIKNRVRFNEELVGILAQAFASMVRDQIFVSGQSTFLNQPEFKDLDKVKSIYEIIDNNNLLQVLETNSNSISVKIGREIEVKAMEDCTIISVPYQTKVGERGALAVIGPKRMEYKKVIPLLEYIAKYVSKMD